jgi:A/G-specific adenine glycosylase
VIDSQSFRAALLAWYDANRRTLVWRTDIPDPYRVWLSEIMLQQTTTPHATPYFLKFTKAWPTVNDLAAARDEDVMAAWAGLGYYARARNLLAGARAVANNHGGVFPDTEAGLRALPGVGAYTAAAVASIAFGRAANVVDGNVERVMSRVFAVEKPLPKAKAELTSLAAGFVTDERPGDWAQALMDLGATVCKPKSPLCMLCPVREFCAGFRTGQPESYPRKTPKAERPRRYGHTYVLKRGNAVAMVRRPPKGLLGGMLGLPTSEWTSSLQPSDPPVTADWKRVGEIEHVFTHFALTLEVWVAQAVQGDEMVEVEWTGDLSVLPSVFLKAARLGLT